MSEGATPGGKASGAKPPFDAWWLARTVLVTASSGALALTTAWIVSWRYRDADYCDPDDWDSLGTCWPTWAEDAGANVIVWALGVVVFLVFWSPVWLAPIAKLRRPPGRPQRP